jgi:hypothetical protein
LSMATPTQAGPTVCPASEFSSNLNRVPAPNQGDNDHNPQHIAPRNLSCITLGKTTSSTESITNRTLIGRPSTSPTRWHKITSIQLNALRHPQSADGEDLCTRPHARFARSTLGLSVSLRSLVERRGVFSVIPIFFIGMIVLSSADQAIGSLLAIPVIGAWVLHIKWRKSYYARAWTYPYSPSSMSKRFSV